MDKIALGTWSFGGKDWSHGWGDQPQELSESVILAALDSGVTTIDTAAVYGLGKAERIVGNVLQKWPGPQPFVATKCGQSWDESGRFRTEVAPKAIRQDVLNSLERLQLDSIDLMFLHYPSEDSNETLKALETLTILRDEGKIKYLGISNFYYPEIKLAASRFDIYACQLKYSLLDRRVENDTLELCRSKGIKFFAYQPMESGLLSGAFFAPNERLIAEDDWRSRSRLFSKEMLKQLVPVNNALRDVADRHGVSIATVALAWVVGNPDCDLALVGIRNLDQLSDALSVQHLTLTYEDRKKIEIAASQFLQVL